METRVRTRGRITISGVLRRHLDINEGTRIIFAVNEGTREIILTPITRQYVHSLRGKYQGKGLLKALAAERAEARRVDR